MNSELFLERLLRKRGDIVVDDELFVVQQGPQQSASAVQRRGGRRQILMAAVHFLRRRIAADRTQIDLLDQLGTLFGRQGRLLRALLGSALVLLGWRQLGN